MEVLVVVLIIAVLSAIAYPMYTKSITKSKAVEAINLLSMVRNKQLQNFAKKGEYFADFSSVGKLTSDSASEVRNGGSVTVKQYYTVSLNPDKNCVSATYDKGNIKFSFSSSYENAGLGCSGDICASFGNIVGSAESVCVTDTTSVTPPVIPPTPPTPPTTCPSSSKPSATRSCGNCNLGTQTQTVNCNNGAWEALGDWSACSGGGECSPGAEKVIACSSGPDGAERCNDSCQWYVRKPCIDTKECTGSPTRSCGNCNLGTQSRTCDTETGTWGQWSACSGGGTCASGATQSCGGSGTQTCSTSCTWGTCSCPSGTVWNGTSCGCPNPASTMPDGSCCASARPYNSSTSKCCGIPSSGSESEFTGTFEQLSAFFGSRLCPSANYTCDSTSVKTCMSYAPSTKSTLQRSSWTKATLADKDTCDGSHTYTYSGACKTCVDVAGFNPQGVYSGTMSSFSVSSPNGNVPGWVCPDPTSASYPNIGQAVYKSGLSTSTDTRVCGEWCTTGNICYFYGKKENRAYTNGPQTSCVVDVAFLTCPAISGQKSNVSCGAANGYTIKEINCCP